MLEFVLNIQQDKIVGAIENVVKNTGIMGRWQLLGERPRIICDVGHNLAGLTYTVQSIREESAKVSGRAHVVFGMVQDKDIEHIVPMLPTEPNYYVCRAHIERAMDQEKLAEKMQKQGLSCTTYPSVNEAIKAAKSAANPEDVIFITGSCFVVGEALSDSALWRDGDSVAS